LWARGERKIQHHIAVSSDFSPTIGAERVSGTLSARACSLRLLLLRHILEQTFGHRLEKHFLVFFLTRIFSRVQIILDYFFIRCEEAESSVGRSLRGEVVMDRKKAHAQLAFLTLLLTLAASGDDINVCRLAFPSFFAQAPIGAFPQDDDNFDFIDSAEPEAAHDQQFAISLPASCLSEGRQQTSSTLCSGVTTLPATLDHHCNGSALTPLRC
jgi:hypothetical protein